VRHLYVVGNYLDHQYLLDVEYLVALQNLDELNQDVVLTFQLVHQLHLLLFVVDEELRYLSKMDYYQDVVDVGLNFHQLKMDYYRDVALPVLLPDDLALQRFSQLHLVQELVLVAVLVQCFRRERL
jgi:hypothetical protein